VEAAQWRTAHNNGWNRANGMASNTWKLWDNYVIKKIEILLILNCPQSLPRDIGIFF
jgi:hypothetical protein